MEQIRGNCHCQVLTLFTLAFVWQAKITFVLFALLLLVDPVAMDKEEEKYWENWAAEETQAWEVRERVNEHLKKRKAAKEEKKQDEDQGSPDIG